MKGILKYLSREDKWQLGGGGHIIFAPVKPHALERLGWEDEIHFYDKSLGSLYSFEFYSSAGEKVTPVFVSRAWSPAALSQKFTAEVGQERYPVSMTVRKTILSPGILVEELRVKGPKDVQRGKCFLSLNIPIFCELEDIESLASSEIICSKTIDANGKLTKLFVVIAIINGLTPQSYFQVEPGKESIARIFVSIHPNRETAIENLSRAQETPDIFKKSRSEWEEHFSQCPPLQISDKRLQYYWWYRWYIMGLLRFKEGMGPFKYPAISEGWDHYRPQITYSAQTHILEARWLKNPELAQGCLLNFIENQFENGAFPGHLMLDGPRTSFFHANWGEAALELYKIHPDSVFLQKAYDGLSKYANYFLSERDPENSGLYDIWNQYETGQECSPRYLCVERDSDEPSWEKQFRLKGVDVTVYVYQLFNVLGQMAQMLKRPYKETRFWESRAAKTKKAVRTLMWDSSQEMFFDIDPKTMRRTGVKALTCFYPYMTDLVIKKHLSGLKKHLFNPQEFWTPFPFPTVSQDDPNFSAEGIWLGGKEGCPWNGRVWPMTNSHMAEAIAKCAIRFEDGELREKFVQFFNKWIEMMCFNNDCRRPNSFEHYHPFNGSPSSLENGFCGYDDYFHSWINDLVIKYVVGFRPLDNNEFIVDPFPFNQHLFLSGIEFGGCTVDVTIIDGKIFTVWIDEVLQGIGNIGLPLRFSTECLR